MIMYIIAEILPVYILLCGIVMMFFPLSKIAVLFGYMGNVVPKNDEMKLEANSICGKPFIFGGIILIILSFLLLKYISKMKTVVFIMVLVIQFSFMITAVVKTEIYLIKKYGRNGANG